MVILAIMVIHCAVLECDLYCYIMVIIAIMVMYWQTDPTLVVTTANIVRA